MFSLHATNKQVEKEYFISKTNDACVSFLPCAAKNLREKSIKPHHIHDVLFTREQINHRVQAMNDEIAKHYASDNLVLLGVLRGSFIFPADLVRGFARHNLHPRIDFITLSSYGSSTESSGTVRIVLTLPKICTEPMC